MIDNYLALENAQFEIRHVEGEYQVAQESLDVLSKALFSISSYFLLSKPFPKVRVVLVTSRSEFDRLVRDLLHVEIELPSNPARIAQPQRTDMVVLSPSAYESHSIFKYVPDQFGRLLAHELVHMVEEHLCPNIEASPRWWGEGLAIHLSDQWLYDEGFRKPALDGTAQNKIPRFYQIEEEIELAYDWGWTIVRFIESVFGRSAILRIVKECEDGNVFSMIDHKAKNLETQWRNWLLARGSLTREISNNVF